MLLALFALQFGLYLGAIWLARRARQDGRLLALIVAAAVAFRVTLLFSDPIEEIDLYRYLWDGAVATEGVSPFRYSPYQVLAAPADADLPSDLARLVKLRDRSPEMAVILDRVHFGELPTVYPPVSQAIFAIAAWSTPHGASVYWRMTWMKAWFVAFDLATLFLIIGLLRLSAQPVGWSVAYAWCPLLIKEIANSGHLDALAFFLATLSLYFAVLALYGTQGERFKRCAAVAAIIILSLAVGAKLYPVILAPLVLLSSASRFGWRFTFVVAAVFLLVTGILLWPMLP
ncbi:MAG: hypothetical protein KY475_19620, partial [Planctomycetes bacterium]|nr:hypothetical protein [Planctomycetota bacterium]